MPRRKKTGSKKIKSILRSSSRKTKKHKKHSSKRKALNSSVKTVRGHGEYSLNKGSRFKYALKKVNQFTTGKYKGVGGYMKLGRQVGSMFGPLGSIAGSIAGAGLGTIYGNGDYSVKSNTLAIPGTQIPSFDPITGRHCVRVRHREWIGDILSSTSPFVNTVYSMNPGQVFPWLQTVACQFQEYAWSGLIYEFRSESGMAVNSSNTSLGYVAIACDYDATNPKFTSLEQMLNSEFAVSGPPSSNILHTVECKRSETAINTLYVNSGGVPVGSDQRLYDIGTIQVAIGNQQANNTILGSLWASYDIMFFKPILGYSGASQNTVKYYWNGTGTAPTSGALIPSNTVQASGSTMALSFGTSTSTVNMPNNTPLGEYLVQMNFYNSTAPAGYFSGGASYNDFPQIVYNSNCQSSPSIFLSQNHWNAFGSLSSTQVGNILTCQNYMTTTGPSPSFSYSGGTLFGAGSLQNWDLIIQQLNSAINTSSG